MFVRGFSVFLLVLLTLVGCESRNDDQVVGKDNMPAQKVPAPEIKPEALFHEPVNAILVETATAALPIWRKYAPIKPALILFSNDPFLEPIPTELEDQAIEMVRNGSADQIKTRAVDITPNPLLLHRMAVDAAIKADFFSEIIWVLPSKDDAPLPPLEDFRQSMVEAGLISQTEAATLTKQGGSFSGSFRGMPVMIGNLSAIPLPKNPAWIHFDLSFFKPLYKNEVSTPLYPLIFDAFRKIRSAKLISIGATISSSNLGGPLSLKIRFIGRDLAHLIANPESLDASLPELQARRAQNLYLEQFMKKDEILKNCLAMEELAPDDATVKFDLYNVRRTHKQGELALESLDQAVALDPVYALEYIELANTAVEKQRPDAALKLLGKARAIFPGNPLILMQDANLQGKLGHRDAAMALIQELKDLPWSKVYDKNMPEHLAQLEEAVQDVPVGSTQ